jgi:hypothetical protein
MIETLHQLRDEIDRALAILARLAPAIAAWQCSRGPENGVDALAGAPMPADPISSPGEAISTAPASGQDEPGEGEGTAIRPNGSGTPGEAEFGADRRPKRRPGPRPGQPRLTPEERKAAKAEYQRERRARLRVSQRTEAEVDVAELEPLTPDVPVSAEAAERVSTAGAGTTLAGNGLATPDAAARATYGPSEGASPRLRISAPDAEEERDYRRAGREPPRVTAALALPPI